LPVDTRNRKDHHHRIGLSAPSIATCRGGLVSVVAWRSGFEALQPERTMGIDAYPQTIHLIRQASAGAVSAGAVGAAWVPDRGLTSRIGALALPSAELRSRSSLIALRTRLSDLPVDSCGVSCDPDGVYCRAELLRRLRARRSRRARISAGARRSPDESICARRARWRRTCGQCLCRSLCVRRGLAAWRWGSGSAGGRALDHSCGPGAIEDDVLRGTERQLNLEKATH
jgi:hypothetical protein